MKTFYGLLSHLISRDLANGNGATGIRSTRKIYYAGRPGSGPIAGKSPIFSTGAVSAPSKLLARRASAGSGELMPVQGNLSIERLESAAGALAAICQTRNDVLA